jgi:hypothetical protein
MNGGAWLVGAGVCLTTRTGFHTPGLLQAHEMGLSRPKAWRINTV